MGRAIDQDNRLDDHEIRIKTLEGVVAELSSSLMHTKQVKNIDLTESKSRTKKKKVEAEAT